MLLLDLLEYKILRINASLYACWYRKITTVELLYISVKTSLVNYTSEIILQLFQRFHGDLVDVVISQSEPAWIHHDNPAIVSDARVIKVAPAGALRDCAFRRLFIRR